MTPKTYCSDCVYGKMPRQATVFGGLTLSPGKLRVAAAELRLKQERRELERRRVEQGYVFDYPPQTYAWCACFTLDADAVASLREALLAGDEAAIEAFRGKGVNWTEDVTTGTVRPIYDLCAHRNKGDCKSFKKKAQP